MTRIWLNRIRRGLSRSPAEIRRRLAVEVAAQTDRFRRPPLAGIDAGGLAARLGAKDLEGLWDALADRAHPYLADHVEAGALEAFAPGEGARIEAAAEAAHARRVDLLGSGPVTLSGPVDWQRDIKSGLAWRLKFHRDLDLLQLDRPSDVKLPWELSRLQWLIPAAQAYQLRGGERHGEAVRDILTEWIAANPFCMGVNWTSAMEAAMRIFTWTWFFHVFKTSAAWKEGDFRLAFLLALYRHGVFLDRNLEDWGSGGNHCVAGAAGLCVAGLFFDHRADTGQWSERGWRLLSREIERQVHADGVDFEASAAYHRLVAELFLLAVRYRGAAGLDVEPAFEARLAAMAGFTSAYLGPDDWAPLWGDGDDGRVLPFGGQPVRDHSYLPAAIGVAAPPASDAARGELFWMLGSSAAPTAGQPGSRAFPEGGVYVMRGGGDHVFIDCGEVGSAGLGAHGHNDCLSFEAVLDGVRLIVDSGSFVYSAAPDARHRFRATISHNTPMIDGAEQNRLPAAGELFRLGDDATPRLHRWRAGRSRDLFEGSHDGYARLASPVTPHRRILLDKENHRLSVEDRFTGSGTHHITVPYHLAPDIGIEEEGEGRWRLDAGGRPFILACLDWRAWTAEPRDCEVSPSYGVRLESRALVFERRGELTGLRVLVSPADAVPPDLEVCFKAPD